MGLVFAIESLPNDHACVNGSNVASVLSEYWENLVGGSCSREYQVFVSDNRVSFASGDSTSFIDGMNICCYLIHVMFFFQLSHHLELRFRI